MSTYSRQYRPSRFDNVENIEDYTPEGFHPVHLGDVFKDRYKVLHKLGCGGFSTVWLALHKLEHRYIALKIIRAEASSACSELKILQKLNSNPNDSPGKKHITSLFNHFIIDGPNGMHVCLVSDMAGPSVTALHDCPDITASNLLFKLASINEWSEDEVYQRFGEPQKDSVRTISGSNPGSSAPRYLAPRYLVESAGLVDPQFLAEDILLIDFGQSFSFDNPPRSEDIGIPFSYCAPEVIFDSRIDKFFEIWALRCVLFKLRAGQQLFPGWSGGQDEILRQMVQTFGRLPSPWWNAWKKRTDFFNDDGTPKQEWSDGIPKAVEYPMDELIADIGSEDEEEDEPRNTEALLEPSGTRIPQEETGQLMDLFDHIFKWVPEERISLDDILNHSWFATNTKA